jgi:hypothetical protein
MPEGSLRASDDRIDLGADVAAVPDEVALEIHRRVRTGAISARSADHGE